MAYFLFLDESGHDHRDSPYEVLAGVCIKDSELWNLIRLIRDVEFEVFDCKYNVHNKREVKARKFLNRKTFRLANQMPMFHPDERTKLANQALTSTEPITKAQLTALAQAKLAYIGKVLELCNAFRCRVFASILSTPSVISKDKSLLRKDYIYLFERFYYFLEDRAIDNFGVFVFDEIEKSESHLLIGQMDKYFKRTSKGAIRSNLIVPEPFFVHSELTTGIQLADIIAYIISWNLRTTKHLTHERRTELDRFMSLIKPMQYSTKRQIDGEEISIYSIRII